MTKKDGCRPHSGRMKRKPRRVTCEYCKSRYVRSENIHQCKDGGEAMRKAFLSPCRVVLGVGHPWFTHRVVCLDKHAGLGKEAIRLQWDDLGNWNKIRLVAEVLK